eukprot:CAMPEP_0170540080 /NCGR_PEP_ID=MMETSP0211-20121228/98_1 /TAXON_ID=311385 /ORGANISM="Pseudokeronopsis sp., Strain OXSARD2" /LENGTH=606 /DNA_ID=CAMNT_0010842351 /DNA_START=1922 /DNA_END=3742 /DNA_ORIENTATION=+
MLHLDVIVNLELGDAGVEVLDVGLELVSVGLLDEVDVLRHLDLHDLPLVLLPLTLLIHLYLKHRQDPVLPHREQKLVVETYPETLHREAVGLHLVDPLEIVPEHLYRPWPVLLSDPRKNRVPSMHQNYLRNVHVAFVARELFFAVFYLLECPISAHSIDGILAFGLVGDAGEDDVLLVVLEDRVGLFLVPLLVRVQVQLPQVYLRIIPTGDEAAVVVEPLDALDLPDVGLLEVVLAGLFGSVELVDAHLVLICAGEEVASIRKPDVPAALDGDLLEGLQVLRKHIHHADLVGETHDDVEAGGVESDAVGFILEDLADLQLLLLVVPDPHALINATSHNLLFLDADIHAVDGSGVEGVDEVLILSVIRGPLQVQIDLHELVVLRGEDDHVFRAREGEGLDSAGHDAGLQLGVVLVLLAVAAGGQGRSLVVRVLGLLALVVNVDLAVFAGDDEAFGVGGDALDVEALAGGLWEQHLVLPRRLQPHYLALIRANDDLPIRKPSMACVVERDVSFLLDDLPMDELKEVVFAESVVLVGVVACDQDHIGVHIAETALIHHALPHLHVVRGHPHLLHRETLRLVPHPDYDFPIRLSSECGKEAFFVLGLEGD